MAGETQTRSQYVWMRRDPLTGKWFFFSRVNIVEQKGCADNLCQRWSLQFFGLESAGGSSMSGPRGHQNH
jgi:hypothetical protein